MIKDTKVDDREVEEDKRGWDEGLAWGTNLSNFIARKARSQNRKVQDI